MKQIHIVDSDIISRVAKAIHDGRRRRMPPIEQAILAITAMRNPTESMVVTAEAKGGKQVLRIWQIMIGEALNEPCRFD